MPPVINFQENSLALGEPCRHCQQPVPSPSTSTMAVEGIWSERARVLKGIFVHLVVIACLYLASELLVWALSLALSQINLRFFSSILGMIVIFTSATLISLLWKDFESFHHLWVKQKVDFINSHISIAFPIPLVLLNPTEILPGSEIARIIGVFLATTIIGWVVTFALCCSVVGAVEACRKQSSRHEGPSDRKTKSISAKSSFNGSETVTDIESSTMENSRPVWSPVPMSLVDVAIENWFIITPLAGTFVLGIPFAAVQKDHRPLDIFVLWFLWIGTVKCQRWLKAIAARRINRRKQVTILTTLANPVLFTALLMLAYTRAEAVIIGGQEALSRILHMFSSGTPLYALWTALVNGQALPQNPSGWFGAGDVALSALECGIVIWGFKLFECRRQLASLSGLCTVVLCIATAAANVFLSVLLGKAVGLSPGEALAFAARNTTLALSRPSMETIGGNTVVNAALVVCNGILGQLLYPFIIDKLTCSRLSFALKKTEAVPDGLNGDSASSEMTVGSESDQTPSERDDIMTVATGVTVGINGAAMGVSYLYENKSRSAPYAALAMTVYGVMTVVFATVGPFKTLVESLAH